MFYWIMSGSNGDGAWLKKIRRILPKREGVEVGNQRRQKRDLLCTGVVWFTVTGRVLQGVGGGSYGNRGVYVCLLERGGGRTPLPF